MRILYFYQYFTTPRGSYSTRTYEFARRWVKAGDSVTVVTSVYDRSDLKPQSLISRFDVAGIDVRVINIRLSNKHGVAVRMVTFVAYALLASWYALVLPADVVVSSSGPLTVGLPGLVARYLRRRPLVFEVRDLWPEGAIQLGMLRNPLLIGLARFLERRCYKAAATVVALSDGMAGWLRRRYGLNHLEVVPNASDNELVKKNRDVPGLPQWTEGKHLVIYAGALGLIDDCGQIVDAANVLQAWGIRDLEFVLIGDGAEREALERKARDLKLDHVHFLGLRSKEEVMHWLQAACCSLFVVRDVPFLATASPNKLFDAFAAGVPVIQTTQGWIKDLLERQGCGITVRSNDPEAMAEGVLNLVKDDSLRSGLAQNARRVATELFDRDLLATKMRGVLVEAVSGRSCAQSMAARRSDA